jgi:DNA replication ATP-dependent helicase Dna2
MQRCMEAGRWDKKWIEDRIEEVVRSPMGLGELVKLGVGIETARFEIRARAGGLELFAKRFVGPTVKVSVIGFNLFDAH